MSMKSKLGLIAMMAAMAEMGSSENKSIIDRTESYPPTPKGAFRYFFNDQGRFSTEQMKKEDVVFTCIARTERKALEKYDKFKKLKL